MDTFTLLLAILFMFLAFQYGQSWLVFGIAAVMILTMRSLPATVIIIIGLIAIYAIKATELNSYLPFIMFGLIILALIFGLKPKQAQSEFYPPEGYEEMMGGMGGM